jgi:uncharacterized protein YdhG (YjbR/CyaY superfamily)
MTDNSIDTYMKRLGKDVQERLSLIRKIMQEEVPEYEEVISYGIPTFKRNGKPVVYFAGYKDHISLHPATDEFPALEQYRTGKGTFQFPLDAPLPLDLIRKFVIFRVQKVGDKK